MIQRDMPQGGIDVFGCTRRVRDVLVKLEEANSSLVAQLIWLGFRRAQIPYVRQPRLAGKSAWTFRKKLAYMLNSIFAFTAFPITIISLLGAVGVTGSLAVGCVVLGSWWMELIQVPGYTPLMLVILLSTSTILLSLGVVGSYVWRTFENSQHRPQALTLLRESYNSSTSCEASHERLCSPDGDL